MPTPSDVPADIIDLNDRTALRANPAADTEAARELAEFLELVRVVRESAEPDCAVDAMSIEDFKGATDVNPPRK